MKISVIIPAYNAEKTIENCLNSLISQEYKNIEIIVVNDGSQDLTGDIVKKYQTKDKRIIYIENENHGVSYSRNCGVEAATGDYINFVDADDYLDLDCYEKIIPLLKNDIDFLRYNFKIDGTGGFNNNLYELSDKKIEFNNGFHNDTYMHFFTSYDRIPCLVMLLIIKKSVAQKISFNEKLTMMEDADYYLQLFQNSTSAKFIDYQKYNYCVNSNSVSHSDKNYEKNIFGILDTNISVCNRIEKKYVKLIHEINANHLRIISNYLKLQYKVSHKLYNEIICKLKKNENFKELIKEYNYLPIKKKIYYFSIKYNFGLLENIITRLWK